MKPTFYNTVEKEVIVSVSSRQDKSGNIWFYCEYMFADSLNYIRFENMSSVIDFIKSNF